MVEEYTRLKRRELLVALLRLDAVAHEEQLQQPVEVAVGVAKVGVDEVDERLVGAPLPLGLAGLQLLLGVRHEDLEQADLVAA